MHYQYPLHRQFLTTIAPTPGAVADDRFNADSRFVETIAGIACGLACGQGVQDRGAVLGAATAAKFVGVSLLQPGGYLFRATLALLTKGDVWVAPGSAVRAGGAVTFHRVTGVLSSAPVDADNFQIAGARWMTTAQVGALAVVRLSGALPAQ
jgi:hypothetical protein